MKNLKVLHIIDSLGLGGAQTVVKGLFEIQNNNKNVFLYSLRKKDIKTKINHKNIFIFNSKRKFSLKSLKELKKIIEEEKIEIIHCHLFKSQLFGWILKSFYFPKLKLIQHEHGAIFLKNLFYILFIIISKNKTDLFLAISKATKNNLIKKGRVSINKIKVLYNFVDSKKFNKNNINWDIKEERKKIGVRKEDFVVGFAGRLVERKGWREFIEAANMLCKKNNYFKFLIAGKGEDEKKLLALTKKYKLKNSVFYLNYISDMNKFYSLLDCFVIPSHWEPMGLTEIEAQSMGVLVIASDVPGLNEIIKHKKNGLLFKSKDMQSLARNITLIFKEDNLKNKMTSNSLKSVKKYSIDKYVLNLKKIYDVIKN